jgi:hypothetical protein
MSAAIDGLMLLLAPTNLLALVAVGLLAGRQGSRVLVSGILFALGLLIGSFAIASAMRDPPAAAALLTIAAVAGIFLAAAYRPPLPIMLVLALAGGTALALNAPPQAITLPGAVVTQLATGVAAVGTFCGVALFAASARAFRHHIALRMVGAWIAASAILVLALRFAR